MRSICNAYYAYRTIHLNSDNDLTNTIQTFEEVKREDCYKEESIFVELGFKGGRRHRSTSLNVFFLFEKEEFDLVKKC